VRSALAGAVAVVAGDPGLWALGLLGFLARGGLLLLALPILTIPGPVLLSIVFREQITSADGLAGSPLLVLLGATLVAGVILFGVLAAAWAEVHAFERTVSDPETEALRRSLPARPRSLEPGERSSLVLWVAAIFAAGLVPILLAVLLAGDQMGHALVAETQAPSSVGAPLVVRVIGGARLELALCLVVALVVEALVSLGSRRLLAARYSVLPEGAGAESEASETRTALAGALRLVHQPARSLGVALLCWGVTIVGVGLALLVIEVSWTNVRDVLLSLADPTRPALLLVAAIELAVFCAVWLGALLLVGVTSALRTALWTVDAVR
jgi:hypothetical protein